MEHEAFFATVCQVLPVLMLAATVDLALSPSQEAEIRGPSSRSQLRDDRDEIDLEKLDALISDFEKLLRRRPIGDRIFSVVNVYYTFCLPVIGAGSIALSALVLLGTFEDSWWTLTLVNFGFMVYLSTFAAAVIFRHLPEYSRRKSQRSRGLEVLSDLKETRSKVAELQARKAALIAARSGHSDQAHESISGSSQLRV